MSVYDNILGIAQISIKNHDSQKAITEKLLDEFNLQHLRTINSVLNHLNTWIDALPVGLVRPPAPRELSMDSYLRLVAILWKLSGLSFSRSIDSSFERCF